jgi:uncharacterized protein (TIGR02246 family)
VDPDTASSAVASDIMGHFVAAWNRHDIGAFGRLFHDDAAFVNVAGACMRGREEIGRVHAAGHAGAFRSSFLSAELLDARRLGTGVVLAHVSTHLRGDSRAAGQVRDTLMTLVIEWRDATWKIIAAHNGNVVAQPG